MAIEHFSDELIQEYLDGNLSLSQAAEVAAHTGECPDCARRVQQYEQLFVGLTDDSGFDLPKNFAADTASRTESESISERSFDWLLISGGVAAILAVVVYFFDLSSILPSLESFGREQSSLFVGTLDKCKGMMLSFGLRPDLVFFGGLTLLVISALDRAIEMARHGRAMFLT